MAFTAAHSLRRSFVLTLAVLYSVATLVNLTVFLTSARHLTRNYVERYATARNILEQNRIRSLLGRETALCLKLADDQAIVGWLRNEADAAAEATALSQLGSYQRLFRDQTIFIAAAGSRRYFVSTRNQSITAAVVLDPANPGDRWFFETLTGSADFWINVNYDAFLDEIRVWINTALRDEAGTMVGVAGTGMDLSTFLASLVEHDERQLTSVIVNGEGQILAYRDRAIIEHNARVAVDADRIDIYQLFDQPADRAVLGETLAALASTRISAGGLDMPPVLLRLRYGGAPVTTALAAIPELGWYNLVMVEDSLVIGPGDFVPFLLATVLSLSLILGIVLVQLDQLVLRPLGALTAAANQVAKGDYRLNLALENRNETGLLAGAFRFMTGRINDYTAHLEQMVAERTSELAESRDRLLGSIRSGRLIQTSILPSERDMAEHLGAHHLWLRPLDTVGGDFAFFRPLPDGFCAAVVDCTGHGVPGAFMTMMAASLLNRIAATGPADDSGRLLQRLHLALLDNLRAAKDTAHLENGLDIALCRYRRPQAVLEFSGAGLPLFLTDRDGPRQIDGARLHLGFERSGQADLPVHRLPCGGGQRFHLVSDGILDLPGGEHGFGLSAAGFLNHLAASWRQPLTRQAAAIESACAAWQGLHGQRDDLCLFSFELPMPDAGGGAAPTPEEKR